VRERKFRPTSPSESPRASLSLPPFASSCSSRSPSYFTGSLPSLPSPRSLPSLTPLGRTRREEEEEGGEVKMSLREGWSEEGGEWEGGGEGGEGGTEARAGTN
jgi:hypothetical protein